MGAARKLEQEPQQSTHLGQGSTIALEDMGRGQRYFGKVYQAERTRGID